MALHVGSTGPPIRANTMEPEVFRQIMNTAFCGRIGILGSADFGVTQNGSPNMSVNVSSGFAVVPGTSNAPVQGAYHVYNDATVNVALSASNPTNPRIDTIYVAVQDAFYSGGTNTAVLTVATGIANASPAFPILPANVVALAHIYVAANVTSITNSNINTTSGVNNPDTIAYTPPRCSELQAFVTGTGGTITSIASPGVVVPGLTVNVNVGNASHNIRVRYSVTFSNTSTTAAAVAEVYRDGTGGTALSQSFSLVGLPATAGYVTVVGEVIDTPAAGTHTYGVYAYSTAANTQTYTVSRGSLAVEDIGPV